MADLDALLIRLRPHLSFSPDPVEDEQLGLLYIATYCDENGFPVRVIDEPAPTIELLLRSIEHSKAKVVGFFCDHENISSVFEVARCIREAHPDVLMVAGGPQASASPWDERIIRESEIDMVACGEGEQTFLEILKWRIRGEGALKNIDGLVFQDEGRIVHNPPRALRRDLDTLPAPVRTFNYLGKPPNGSENIVTARGCPYHCAFCYEGQRIKVRRRSTADVLAEIEYLLRERNMYYLAILDDVFTMSTKHVREICDGIKELQKKYHAFYWFAEGRADILCKHPEMLDWMRDAGLVRLQIGVETGSQKVLDAYNKKLTLDEIRECVKLCYEKDILSVVGNFIIGGAFETWETVGESIHFACELMELAPGCFDFNTTIYTPYPATPMYTSPEEFGMTMLDQDCVTGPGDNYAFCATEGMSKWEILDARHVFMEAVENKAASLVPQISEERRVQHFQIHYLIHMHTIWVQMLSRSRNFYNYYGLQACSDKLPIGKLEGENLHTYRPVRTVNIGASYEGDLVLKVNGKALRFNKLGEKVFEYCYGKLTVKDIVERIVDEFDMRDVRDEAERYVHRTLENLDQEKLVIFSPI